MKHFVIGLLYLGSLTTLWAQENGKVEQLDSVLIDTKSKMNIKNSGKVVARITPDMLAQNEGSSLAELLNELSGIEINGNLSNEGQNLSYFVRGGSNRQVVVMVDGVQLNDASQLANDFDLRLIDLNRVASVEVLKGASSVLYGSGAATAVIHIRTKKSGMNAVSASVNSSIGTNQSAENQDFNPSLIENQVSVNGSPGKLFYAIDFSHRFADGLSAIAAAEGSEAFESDVYNRFNTRLNLGYNITEKIQLSQFVAIDKFKSDFDDFSYMDADNRTISRQLRRGGNFKWSYKNGSFVFNDSYSWVEREIESSFPAKYDSKAYTFDTYFDHRLGSNFHLVVGLNGNFSRINSYTIPFGSTAFEQQTDSEDANFSILDPYLNAVYVSDFGFNLNAGLRLNIHSVYDTHVVYQINPSYRFDLGDHAIKLLGSYSTAYITPSLFQLFDPIYGNQNLIPEENRTIEGGITYGFGNVFSLSAVYFDRKEDNFVDFVNVDPENFVFQYWNSDTQFNANGIEINTSAKISEKWTLNTNYTYTQVDDRFSLRIPEHKVNAALLFRLNEGTNFQLKYLFTGEREEVYFNPDTFESESVTLNSYGLVGFNVRTRVNETISLFAAVSNLLNEEYEELYRYQAQGRNVRAGFNLELN
ncbi:MAG: TonB-dependent receptor [Flavobacterium sp.]|nr:MAG: TonB-dependent receptor [Flavobacterium sp.]